MNWIHKIPRFFSKQTPKQFFFSLSLSLFLKIPVFSLNIKCLFKNKKTFLKLMHRNYVWKIYCILLKLQIHFLFISAIISLILFPKKKTNWKNKKKENLHKTNIIWEKP